jgi:hypothetical protein
VSVTVDTWDDQAASFTPRTIDAPLGAGGEYRAVITMRWLRNGLEGRSVHVADWVRKTIDGNAFIDGPAATCEEILQV